MTDIMVPRLVVGGTGPAPTGVNLPLPTGAGFHRNDTVQVDPTRPSAIFDPSVNQNQGITFGVGGRPKKQGQ